MGQAVVTEVIAEGSLGQLPAGIDVAADAEIGLGVDGQLFACADHRHAAAAQRTGEGQFAQPLGQRHHGGHGHGRRPADEDVHPQRLLEFHGRGVMHADAAMDLVMQSDLAIGLILVAAELHAIHAQVRTQQARVAGIFRIDLRQGDVGAAVVGPRLELRQLIDRRLAFQHGPRARVSARCARPSTGP